jgi:hypothetical protein
MIIICTKHYNLYYSRLYVVLSCGDMLLAVLLHVCSCVHADELVLTISVVVSTSRGSWGRGGTTSSSFRQGSRRHRVRQCLVRYMLLFLRKRD